MSDIKTDVSTTNPVAHVHSRFGGYATPADIAPYVLLPTDASQIERIVAQWDTARRVTHHYEFLLYTGEYAGVPLTACSTGLGGMSVSIAVEELARLGAKTLLHLGCAETVSDKASPGEVVIAKGAVRFDGTSHDHARPEFPALAHYELVLAGIAAAEAGGLPYHVEVVSSMAASGAAIPRRFGHFWQERTASMHEALRQAGVFAGSGQEATLFVQSAIYGLRAGALIGCPTDDRGDLDDQVLGAGLEAIRILAEWDRRKAVNEQADITL